MSKMKLMMVTLCAVLLSMSGLIACGGDETTATGSTGAGASSAGGVGATGGATPGSGGNGGGSTNELVSEYCEKVAEPFCLAYFNCCTSQQSLDFWGGTVDACTAKMKADCFVLDGAGAIHYLASKGQVTLNEERLKQCTDNLQSLQQPCPHSPLVVYLYQCYAAFTTTAKIGEPCNVDPDVAFAGCEEGAYCENGTCKGYQALGESCSAHGQKCDLAKGEGCIDDTSCQPQKPNGGSCTASLQCVSVACDTDKNVCVTPIPSLMCTL